MEVDVSEDRILFFFLSFKYFYRDIIEQLKDAILINEIQFFTID